MSFQMRVTRSLDRHHLAHRSLDFDLTHSIQSSALLPTKEKPIKQVDLLTIAEVVMHALPTEAKAHVHLHVRIRVAACGARRVLEPLQEIHALQVRIVDTPGSGGGGGVGGRGGLLEHVEVGARRGLRVLRGGLGRHARAGRRGVDCARGW